MDNLNFIGRCAVCTQSVEMTYSRMLIPPKHENDPGHVRFALVSNPVHLECEHGFEVLKEQRRNGE